MCCTNNCVQRSHLTSHHSAEVVVDREIVQQGGALQQAPCWPEAEIEVLFIQVAVNKSAAVANEAMQMQLGQLQRELAAAQAAASAAGDSQQRAQAAEKAAADARLEAQNALAAAAAMEERVQAAEEEMDSVAGMLYPPCSLKH